jgi:hypothetical protein
MIFLGGLVVLVFALAALPVLAQQPSPSMIPKAKSQLKAQEAPKTKKEAKKTTPVPGRSAFPDARQAMRRDPFRSLKKLAAEGGPGQPQLPPGKRGLVISQLSVEGIVIGATGNIAVVTMPGRDRSFFLRERDQLFDGLVTAILGDRVIFREKTRDLFGRRIERDVTKELVTVPES